MKSIHLFTVLIAMILTACVTTQESPIEIDSGLPAGTQSGKVQAADGVKIHYVEIGSGVPIVLLHGYYADLKSNWFDNGIAQELAKTNRVIAIDLRGHGQSDKPHASREYGGRMWTDVIAVMDQLNVSKAQVHGYSMGGSIVTQLLYYHPERFISAIYGGSGVSPSAKHTATDMVADSKGADPQEKDAMKLLMTGMKHDLVAMKALKENAPWAGDESDKIDLKKLAIPVLALNGEFDTPNEKTYRLQKSVSRFQNVIFKGRSHLTTIAPGYMPPQYLVELEAFVQANNQ